MHLFSGSSHPALAEKLARELGATLGSITLKRFSCGERYVKFDESIRGKDVFIVQTGTDKPDEDLMELFLMCQAAKLSFAERIHVLLPHFPYARQDRVAEPREPISAKLVASLLETAGADHIITLDLHSAQIQGFFSVPVDVLEARTLFRDYFLQKKLEKPVVVSPDIGSAKQSKKLSDALGADLAIVHKSRTAHNKSEVLEVVGNVEGRTCIVFDDMIDTAGTLASAKKALISRGANPKVYAAATHGIFSGPAIERMKEAQFEEVVVTDSTPLSADAFPGLKIISIAPMLAEVLTHIQSGQSVTEIYKK